MPQPIVIEDYNPAWPAQFAALCAPVRATLDDVLTTIEHVGSTAIPGLAAKPVIDMDVVIGARDMLGEAIRRMAAIGYAHEGDLGIFDREAFLPPPGLTAHHLYICSAASPELRRHLLFRDFLRAHPQEVQAYGDLKQALAIRFRNDRAGYAEAKTGFVTAILKRAADS